MGATAGTPGTWDGPTKLLILVVWKCRKNAAAASPEMACRHLHWSVCSVSPVPSVGSGPGSFRRLCLQALSACKEPRRAHCGGGGGTDRAALPDGPARGRSCPTSGRLQCHELLGGGSQRPHVRAGESETASFLPAPRGLWTCNLVASALRPTPRARNSQLSSPCSLPQAGRRGRRDVLVWCSILLWTLVLLRACSEAPISTVIVSEITLISLLTEACGLQCRFHGCPNGVCPATGRWSLVASSF